jgi:hypothetical protein
MTIKFDALLNEVDEDTLARLSVAVTAGVITAVTARKLYKQYKDNQLLKKYGRTQEENKHQSLGDDLRGVIPDLVDINTTRYLINAKKIRNAKL